MRVWRFQTDFNQESFNVEGKFILSAETETNYLSFAKRKKLSQIR